jgi:hypothetical protein
LKKKLSKITSKEEEIELVRNILQALKEDKKKLKKKQKTKSGRI